MWLYSYIHGREGVNMGHPPPPSKYPEYPQNTKTKAHGKVLTNQTKGDIMYT